MTIVNWQLLGKVGNIIKTDCPVCEQELTELKEDRLWVCIDCTRLWEKHELEVPSHVQCRLHLLGLTAYYNWRRPSESAPPPEYLKFATLPPYPIGWNGCNAITTADSGRLVFHYDSYDFEKQEAHYRLLPEIEQQIYEALVGL